jgi:hypothetical protein
MKIFQAASEFLPMIDEVKEKEKSSSIYLARSRYSQSAAPCDAGVWIARR